MKTAALQALARAETECIASRFSRFVHAIIVVVVVDDDDDDDSSSSSSNHDDDDGGGGQSIIRHPANL